MSPEIESERAFAGRHIGPRPHDVRQMLESMGLRSLDELIDQTIPESIRLKNDLNLPEASSEHDLLGQLQKIGAKNRVFRSYIGMGYHDTIVPGVILRNVLENPGWYTQYTPYQAEISQGRLEALLNFQTMVIDLTGMEIANASLLDEATAAAEAMTMLFAEKKDEAPRYSSFRRVAIRRRSRWFGAGQSHWASRSWSACTTTSTSRLSARSSSEA